MKQEFHGFNRVKCQKSYFWLILFWIGWVILIIVLVFGFWMIDNKWLEDRWLY